MNLQLIIILLLFFVGLFIKPFAYGLWDFVYKFVVFVAATYLLYRNFVYEKEENNDENFERKINKTIPEEINNDHAVNWKLSDLINEDEASKQYIIDQFLALAGIVLPDQGWIFHKFDNYKLNVIKQHSFSDLTLEDIPNQIDLSGIFKIIDDRDEILIENNIKNANYSFQYYNNTVYSVASFISIPISISNSEKFFFIYDSETAEQFNINDNEIIEKIGSGIQSTIKYRLNSISLLSELKSNKKLLAFSLQINNCNTISTAIDVLSNFVSSEFEADRLTICTTMQNSNKAVIRKVVGQKDIFNKDHEFILEEGLTGWVISKNKPYVIEDLEKGEYFIPRYGKDEKTNFGLRSFLGIPFSFKENVYGAITLEDHLPNKYSNDDKEFLQQISNIFKTIFNRKNTNKKEI